MPEHLRSRPARDFQPERHGRSGAAGSLRQERGFSLAENLFAAVIMAIIVVGMSQVLSTYTVSETRAGDVQFALDLAESQLDMIRQQVETQDELATDPSDGRTFQVDSGGVDVALTQYFFNNFPTDATPDNSVPMSALPWDGSGNWGNYLSNTVFWNNAYFDAGGNQKGGTPENAACGFNLFKDNMLSDDPPRFAVRMELFGIPYEEEGAGSLVSLSGYEACGDGYTGNPNQYADPPASCRYLIADSCVPTNGTPCQGGMWAYSSPSEGTWTKATPYFDHYTSKILEAQVYRAVDFRNAYTFYNTTTGKLLHPIASASVQLDGRLLPR